jgi:hypothetical protein
VIYGEGNHIERTDTAETVPVKGPYGVRTIALIVEPGSAGPCVTVSVPSSTEPGDYRVVLDDVQGQGEVSANFEVSGEPLETVPWEIQLRAAARANHQDP